MTRAKPKLLEQVRSFMRTFHYSRRTEDACCEWIKRFILVHGKPHSPQLAEAVTVPQRTVIFCKPRKCHSPARCRSLAAGVGSVGESRSGLDDAPVGALADRSVVAKAETRRDA